MAQALETAQSRNRARVRNNLLKQPQAKQAQEEEPKEIEDGSDYAEEDSTSQPALQYYNAQPDSQNRIVLIASDQEYNGLYGRPTAAPRSRDTYSRPAAKTTSNQARTKEPSKETVQTIRNYSKVNDDGSFTFGYEAADGSFKEENRGTDCVVRGKYGYVDPDGNKREFTYVSGNPCDPNNPEQNDEEVEREEESNEPENVPDNFPRRPIKPQQRYQTTTHAPTTVFQNQYASNTYNDEQDSIEQGRRELVQPLKPGASARPQHLPVIDEVTIKQRPRITVNTTPTPVYRIQSPAGQNLRELAQTQPPATTYRPAVQYFTQKNLPASFTKAAQQSYDPNTKISQTSTRGPIDFIAEFQKFQLDNNIGTTTTRPSNLKTYRPSPGVQKLEIPQATPNPIYETQLVFDPSNGQIDPSLIPQNIAYRIPTNYVPQHHQPFHPSPQIVTLEQLQQQQQQTQSVYQRPLTQPTTRNPLQFPQFSQQVCFNRLTSFLLCFNNSRKMAQYYVSLNTEFQCGG